MMSSISETTIPGGWAQRAVRIVDREFQLLLPARPNDFLSQMKAAPNATDDPIEPYWAALWSAAPQTAEFVLRRAAWPAHARVLEIGCGIGLAGLAALAKGFDVTFSDYVPDAVRLAVENGARNGWDAKGLVVDWRTPPAEMFDVILASDILYDAGHYSSIFRALKTMLAPNGVCWIGDSGRPTVKTFLRMAAENHWNVRLRNSTGGTLSFPTTRQFQLLELTSACDSGNAQPQSKHD